MKSLATVSVVLLAFCLCGVAPAYATEFRVGSALPVTSIIGSSSTNFKTGIGIEAIMDIQTDRESSYYINISSVTIPGMENPLDNSAEILVKPNVSWWGFALGAAYFPLRRKEGVTPVLSAEYGFQFVTEEINKNDLIVGSNDVSRNSIMFQTLGFSLGLEHQINNHLSIHGRGRININIPMNVPKNYSLIYSNTEYRFLVAQAVVGIEYRIGK